MIMNILVENNFAVGIMVTKQLHHGIQSSSIAGNTYIKNVTYVMMYRRYQGQRVV